MDSKPAPDSAIFLRAPLSFDEKVRLAMDRIREFQPQQGYWLAYSGGKDSVVIKDLAVKAGAKFTAHYNLTTIDPPELVQFIKRQQDILIEKPKAPFLKMVLKKGLPWRKRRWCCEYYKERTPANNFILTGIRAEESIARQKRRLVEVCFRDNSKTFLHPIIDWTTKEVWRYIKTNELEYCTLYDLGWKRIGCLFCPYASALAKEREILAYPKVAKAFVRACDKLIEKRRLANRVNSQLPNGEALFKHYVGNRCLPDKDQLQMWV